MLPYLVKNHEELAAEAKEAYKSFARHVEQHTEWQELPYETIMSKLGPKSPAASLQAESVVAGTQPSAGKSIQSSLHELAGSKETSYYEPKMPVNRKRLIDEDSTYENSILKRQKVDDQVQNASDVSR